MVMDTSKKRKRRVLVIPDDSKDDFVVDEDDYLAVREILSNPHSAIRIPKNDKERRVCKLTLPHGFAGALPSSIGTLTNLAHLDLFNSGIRSLPPSIGHLKNLKELDLSWTKQLRNLPEEIGDLTSLSKLNLSGTCFPFLPPSIGRLTNLKDLNLEHAEILMVLPEEIGDLASLEQLDLRYAVAIESLPSSIGRLTNLKDLDLTGTINLDRLPVDILNLTDLRCRFDDHCDHYVDDWGRSYTESRVCESCPIAKKLCYAMAHNNAEWRTGLGITGKEEDDSVRLLSRLWPLVLRNANRAFEHPYNRYLKLKQPDAIYQLLCDGRESFVGVIVNRGSNRDSGPTI